MHANVPSPVHNEFEGKVHCKNIDTEKGTCKGWNEKSLAKEENPKAPIGSWTKFAFKSVVTASIMVACSILFTVYFLLARLDIHFVLTKGSVQFPEGGSIQADLTLAGQALPGGIPVEVEVGRATCNIFSVIEDPREQFKHRTGEKQFLARMDIFGSHGNSVTFSSSHVNIYEAKATVTEIQFAALRDSISAFRSLVYENRKDIIVDLGYSCDVPVTATFYNVLGPYTEIKRYNRLLNITDMLINSEAQETEDSSFSASFGVTLESLDGSKGDGTGDGASSDSEEVSETDDYCQEWLCPTCSFAGYCDYSCGFCNASKTDSFTCADLDIAVRAATGHGCSELAAAKEKNADIKEAFKKASRKFDDAIGGLIYETYRSMKNTWRNNFSFDKIIARLVMQTGLKTLYPMLQQFDIVFPPIQYIVGNERMPSRWLVGSSKAQAVNIVSEKNTSLVFSVVCQPVSLLSNTPIESADGDTCKTGLLEPVLLLFGSSDITTGLRLEAKSADDTFFSRLLGEHHHFEASISHDNSDSLTKDKKKGLRQLSLLDSAASAVMVMGNKRWESFRDDAADQCKEDIDRRRSLVGVSSSAFQKTFENSCLDINYDNSYKASACKLENGDWKGTIGVNTASYSYNATIEKDIPSNELSDISKTNLASFPLISLSSVINVAKKNLFKVKKTVIKHGEDQGTKGLSAAASVAADAINDTLALSFFGGYIDGNFSFDGKSFDASAVVHDTFIVEISGTASHSINLGSTDTSFSFGDFVFELRVGKKDGWGNCDKGKFCLLTQVNTEVAYAAHVKAEKSMSFNIPTFKISQRSRHYGNMTGQNFSMTLLANQSLSGNFDTVVDMSLKMEGYKTHLFDSCGGNEAEFEVQMSGPMRRVSCSDLAIHSQSDNCGRVGKKTYVDGKLKNLLNMNNESAYMMSLAMEQIEVMMVNTIERQILNTNKPTPYPTSEPTTKDTASIEVSFDLTGVEREPTVDDKKNLKNAMATALNLDTSNLKNFEVTASISSSRRNLLSESYTWSVSFDVVVSLGDVDDVNDSTGLETSIISTLEDDSLASTIEGELGIEVTVDESSIVTVRLTRNPTMAPTDKPTTPISSSSTLSPTSQAIDKDNDDDISSAGLIGGVSAGAFVIIITGIWVFVLLKRRGYFFKKTDDQQDLVRARNEATMNKEKEREPSKSLHDPDLTESNRFSGRNDMSFVASNPLQENEEDEEEGTSLDSQEEHDHTMIDTFLDELEKAGYNDEEIDDIVQKVTDDDSHINMQKVLEIMKELELKQTNK